MGVSTADLARLFLVAEPTMAARLTRARKKLAVAGVAFALPTPERLAERIDVVATVAYLAFTAGYAPGSGPDVLRAELAGEAIRLTRLLRQLLRGYAVQPPSAATQSAPLLDALLALMLLQHSRREARVDDAGRLVLLPDQDRGRWKRGEIADALGLLAGLPDDPAVLGRRAAEVRLQALIAAEHAVAMRAGDTDWRRIANRYAALDRLTASPVVRLNRAVAVAEADGPEAGLALLDGLDEVMPTSHRVSTVRAELLVRAGRAEEAAAAYERAIGLCTNEAEHAHLRGRREALGREPGRP